MRRIERKINPISRLLTTLRLQRRRHIRGLQDSFTAFERCRKPVMCAVQGACFGGGVDMAVACDIRYCSADARFCVKEVDLAITADIGTLQRLPTLVGHGVATEMALTARVVGAEEARAIGLVTEVAPNAAALEAGGGGARPRGQVAARRAGDEAGDAAREGPQREGGFGVCGDDELGQADVGGPRRGDGRQVRRASADVFETVIIVGSRYNARFLVSRRRSPPRSRVVRRSTFVLCARVCPARVLISATPRRSARWVPAPHQNGADDLRFNGFEAR